MMKNHSVALRVAVILIGLSAVGYAQAPTPPTTGMAGTCQIPKERAKIVCNQSSGFLCVNTPEGGYVSEVFELRGRIDRESYQLASIGISVQNDYTKSTQIVDPPSIQIDDRGYFSARVPLEQTGPYTITVKATRLAGETERQSVVTSRVLPFQLKPENIALDPDIKATPSTDAKSIDVAVSLLGNCSFCDFIGASTGGILVSVVNRITTPDGSTKEVRCQTTTEQQGAGRFQLGVPTLPGKNAMTISACNAAHGATCPALAPIAFQVEGAGDGLTILSPLPLPAYAKSAYPSIPFSFRLAGAKDACVEVFANRERIQACRAGDDIYRVNLIPRIGVNVVTVSSGKRDIPWVFGYGDITSPFAESKTMTVPGALKLSLSESFISHVIFPALNNFLQSDAFQNVFSLLDSEAEDGVQTSSPNIEGQLTEMLPICRPAVSGPILSIALRDRPHIGRAKLESLVMNQGSVDVALNVDDLLVKLNLMGDKDRDGKNDGEPLPMILSFKKAIFHVRLEEQEFQGRDVFLVTSKYNDCDFAPDHYCKHAPTPLIPKNLAGNASGYGHFVACEVAAAHESVLPLCRVLNSLNAQTDIISDKVLSALNQALVCGGSRALLTAMDNIRAMPLNIGPIAGLLGPTSVPLGLTFAGSTMIQPSGIELEPLAGLGDKSFFEALPVKLPSVGLIRNPSQAETPVPSKSLELGLTEDFLNSLLMLATWGGQGKGLLDLDLSEPSFENMGVRFSELCGLSQQPAAICPIRPRLKELLGTTLANQGYLAADQPLLVRIRGNRALAPRLSVVTPSEVPMIEKKEGVVEEPLGSLIEFELPALELSLYALELEENRPPDATGNRPVRLDQQGHPIIRSMLTQADPKQGQIITLELSTLLVLEVGELETDPNDPSQYRVFLRPLADRSRLVLSPVPGTNRTTIADENFGDILREKIKVALVEYSRKEAGFYIPLPKEVQLSSGNGNDAFSLLGLRSLSMGGEGLSLELSPEANVITIGLEPILTQILRRAGTQVTVRLPN
ncbi:MAG: hypothetical protein HY540_06955 [Deltaproteobacteria bacterium]|nr:hypothetical protein [Deltaproteobacteria bacterium]